MMEHAPIPTPTPTAATAMKHTPTPSATVAQAPAPIATQTPIPLPLVRPLPNVQKIAIIEDYAASRFFPDRIVVIENVPLQLYVTRLHKEHVNRFTIEPFLASRAFFPPGTMGVEEFTPDQAGEFKMHNVGHGYRGDFLVAHTVDEARIRIAEGGVQEFSLIHDLQGGRIFPSRLVVQKGVPVRIYNTSLKGDERVSIEPFYTPKDANIKQGAITTFEFTPDAAGEFTIRYDNHEVTATLVVE